MGGGGTLLREIHWPLPSRQRGVHLSLCIDDSRPGEINVVGLALRDDKKLVDRITVDRITKGAARIRSHTPGVSPR